MANEIVTGLAGSDYKAQIEAQRAIRQEGLISTVTELKSDKQLADDLRDQCRVHLLELCKIMDVASRQQMLISWALGVNAYGQRFVQDLQVAKML
jgi:hypothetical protein